jgi:hypothetical protein
MILHSCVHISVHLWKSYSHVSHVYLSGPDFLCCRNHGNNMKIALFISQFLSEASETLILYIYLEISWPWTMYLFWDYFCEQSTLHPHHKALKKCTSKERRLRAKSGTFLGMYFSVNQSMTKVYVIRCSLYVVHMFLLLIDFGLPFFRVFHSPNSCHRFRSQYW